MFDTVDIKGNKYFLIAVYINGAVFTDDGSLE